MAQTKNPIDLHLQRRLGWSSAPNWHAGPAGTAAGGLGLARTAFNQLAKIEGDHRDLAEAIRADDDLSERGRARRLADMRRALDGHLAGARQTIDQARKARAALSERAGPPADKLDPSARAILTAAIWSMLPKEPLELEIAFRDAVSVGDADVVRAITAMPSVHPGALGAKRLAELEVERLQAVDPSLAAEIEELDQAVADLDAYRDDVLETADQLIAYSQDPSAAQDDAHDRLISQIVPQPNDAAAE